MSSLSCSLQVYISTSPITYRTNEVQIFHTYCLLIQDVQLNFFRKQYVLSAKSTVVSYNQIFFYNSNKVKHYTTKYYTSGQKVKFLH